MLNLRKVLGAKPKEHVKADLATMLTPWGEAIDPLRVLEEHPDPQFARQTFRTLNGIWRYTIIQNNHEPTADLAQVTAHAKPPSRGEFSSEILVPFSPEAPLSGVNRQLQPDELLWYLRSFQAPALDGGRCLLHFQAVDYACAVRINDALVGSHVGGYTPFVFDITDYLLQGENELSVCVADPSEFSGRLRGKQRFDRGDIWYTAQSGIWQTVWLEVVPILHVESITLEPDVETGILGAGIRIAGLDEAWAVDPDASANLRMDVFDAQGNLAASQSCEAAEHTCALAAHIPYVHLWSPDDPYLYTVKLTLDKDCVDSYCGFRTVEMKQDEHGHPRVFLNGKPLFIKGILDQAYWSDGLMTAPSDAALTFDIKAMRDAGFNLMRKHIKIECARWYYHCDRLGMIVLQDMVSGGAPEIQLWQWSYKPTLFKVTWNRYRDDKQKHRESLGAGDEKYRREWTQTCCETIRLLENHPSIIGWSLFNEGWGQFDACDATRMGRSLDPTRVGTTKGAAISAASTITSAT